MPANAEAKKNWTSAACVLAIMLYAPDAWYVYTSTYVWVPIFVFPAYVSEQDRLQL